MTRRPVASRALLPSCAVLLALAPLGAPPASAAGTPTVFIGAVTWNGSVLSVAGTSTFADQPFVALTADPAGDTQLPGALGQDLTGVSISMATNGSIAFRWSAADLPPALNGMPATVYGWTFCIGPPQPEEGEPVPLDCWEITGSRMNWLIPNPEPWLQLWRCPSTCQPNELTSIQGTPVLDGGTKTVTARLPLAALSGEPGELVTPMIGFSFHDGAAWTAMAGWYLVEEDFVDFDTAYAIPGRDVSLASRPAAVTRPASPMALGRPWRRTGAPAARWTSRSSPPASTRCTREPASARTTAHTQPGTCRSSRAPGSGMMPT